MAEQPLDANHAGGDGPPSRLDSRELMWVGAMSGLRCIGAHDGAFVDARTVLPVGTMARLHFSVGSTEVSVLV